MVLPRRAPIKKWGFFPAVGFSWNASEEGFFNVYKKQSIVLKHG
jgi:hypothetical protein